MKRFRIIHLSMKWNLPGGGRSPRLTRIILAASTILGADCLLHGPVPPNVRALYAVEISFMRGSFPESWFPLRFAQRGRARGAPGDAMR
jgi:hypothetical protein